MKQLNSFILEKLKINSKSKISSSLSKKEIFEQFNKNYNVFAHNQNRISISLANFAFSLNEKIRKEKYNDLINNIGIQDKITVFMYLLGSSIENGAQAICDTLNESNIGYTNWEVEHDKLPIKLNCYDSNNNKYSIIIYFGQK